MRRMHGGTILADVGMAILVIAGAIAVVAALVFGAAGRRKRQAALEAWATARGWHYTHGEVSSIEQRFAVFSDFTTGSRRYGYNVIRGEEQEREVWAFDYHYETYSHGKHGRQTHHHHFSAVVLHTRLLLKPLSIRNENFFDKLTQAVGFDDIDFESAEFSREFWVKAEDKRWAFDVLHQDTMEFLLGAPRFQMRFSGPWVLVRRNGLLDAATYDEALAVAHGVLDRIPSDLRAGLALPDGHDPRTPV